MSRDLFSEFEPSDKAAWQTQAEKEINGSVGKILSGNFAGKNNIEPYYTESELDEKQAAAMQNAQKEQPSWLNIPYIRTSPDPTFNAKIKAALSSGANGMLLDCRTDGEYEPDFPKILHGVRISETPVFFQTRENPDYFYDKISKIAPYHLKGGIAFDPIADWMSSGRPFTDFIPSLTALIHKTEKMQDFYPVMVESHVFHEAGASPVQELAFTISTLVCYMDLLTNTGIPAEKAFKSIFLSVSTGTEYLTEIAKLRALRFLHKKIGCAYGLSNYSRAFVHVKTSSFYQSKSVPHNNMLRSTSEAMSAVIGGCDALTVQAFDHTFEGTNEFSERIAQNTSLLISDESYISHVADPSAGSYFIENLSIRMADAAWDLFLKSEQRGGIVQSFESGFVQEEIEKSWNYRVEAMQNGGVMVGVNKYVSDVEISPVQPEVESSQEVYAGPLRLLPKRNLANLWNKTPANHETRLH